MISQHRRRFHIWKWNNRWWCDYPHGRASFPTDTAARIWAQNFYSTVYRPREDGPNGSKG